MVDEENLLLTLANCGSLTSGHLQRLHFPAHKEKTVKNRLTTLKDQGLIQRMEWTDKARIRQPALWSLTELGEKQIRSCAAYPGVGPQRAQVMARHDYRLKQMIVRIIEVARLQGLSGIRVFREIKLNPDRRSRKPILDGLVIFETGGAVLPDAALIPLASPTTMPLDRDTLYRVALEADNHTESAQVIADKAGNYQQVMRDPTWQRSWAERFGGAAPLVLWVAPSSPRRDEILKLWSQHWPDGNWLVADDDGLATNAWRYYNDGGIKRKHLVFRARTPVAVPAPVTPLQVPMRRSAAQEHHEQLVAQFDALNAQAPLPLEELLDICPWDANFGGRFNDYGQPLDTAGGLWAWDDYRMQMSLAEQAIWLTYHEEMRATSARLKAEEEDARAFGIPLSQRLQQLRDIGQLTGTLNPEGYPICRSGGSSTSNPRFRPAEAEAFAAYITQQHAIHHALEQEAQHRRDMRRREKEAQEKKEAAARYAAMLAHHAEEVRITTLKRRISTIGRVIKGALALVLVLGLWRSVGNVYELLHISPAERSSALMQQRIEAGAGQCAQVSQDSTLWPLDPDGPRKPIKAGTRVVRLGENSYTWTFRGDRAKVGTTSTSSLSGIEPLGWIGLHDLIPCRA